mgnify:CR=1 FL=1
MKGEKIHVMMKLNRLGEYKGKQYIFTHIDRRSNMVYSPDIKSFTDNMYGMWVSQDKVKWVDRSTT